MFYRFILILFCAVLSSACGGGSSADSRERPIVIDTDGDGVADIDDAFPQDSSESVDTDGDGVGDNADVFPQDSSESVDTDGDGVGDNADVFPQDSNQAGDRDGDSIDDLQDFYPLDSACYMASDGNDQGCYLSLLSMQEYQEKTLYAKRGNNLIIYSPQISRLLELNGETKAFSQLLPFEVEIVSLTYSQSHDRVYVNLADSNDVSFVSAGGLSVLATLDVSSIELLAMKDQLFVLSEDDVFFYDKDGEAERFSFNFSFYRRSSPLYYDEFTHSIFYHYYNELDPVESVSEEISAPDYDLWKIDIAKLEPERANYAFQERYWSLSGHINSISDQHLLIGNDVINKHSMQRLRALDIAGEHTDSLVRNDGLLSVLHGEEQTIVSLFDNKLSLVAQQQFEGEPLLLFGEKSQFVLSIGEARLYLHRIDDSEDIDSDGVSNAIDAFPADPVASVDADDDGSPEQWNEGSSGADSTENLTLDVFPDDAYCWLVNHANSDGGCDYGPRDTDFTPTNITNSNDIIYMLGETSDAIVYRWSIASQQYLPPILLNDLGFFNTQPTAIAFVETHQQLYVSYIDGSVISIDQDTLTSKLLTTFRRPVLNMLATGNFLYVPQEWIHGYYRGFVQREGVAFSINAAGALLQSGQIEGFMAGTYAKYRSWDKANNVIWTGHEREDGNFYKRILQDSETGELTGVNIDGTSDLDGPYKLDDNYRSTNVLVIASPSGQQLLIGNGGIYNVEDDTWQQTPNNVDYAIWTSDEQLVTLEQREQTFFLHRHDQEYGVVESLEFVGNTLGLINSDDTIMVLSNNGEGFVIDVYESQPQP